MQTLAISFRSRVPTCFVAPTKRSANELRNDARWRMRPWHRRRAGPPAFRPTRSFRRCEPRRSPSRRGLCAQLCSDVDLRGQRPVDRTLSGDLQDPRFLLTRERPCKLDLELDAIDHPLAGLALDAVDRMDLRMSQ